MSEKNTGKLRLDDIYSVSSFPRVTVYLWIINPPAPTGDIHDLVPLVAGSLPHAEYVKVHPLVVVGAFLPN